ncbi:uncharacterized protein A1O9_09426 [Exophiala aquamarina CBS 119918]|uniref:Uncharacterized protein n=1 Tax=Exophiala aquamarina CBS 119918 TaxID=1182545 RepID=A0A072PFF5_9EURO|nr:uncharacterized protein A1O9_09426 [Exophiala aquamarina CBS 119918]KEF54260.1 hypothetical protein A1O9_09426 [Exophiala aquamarina CBS 119918]
MDTTIDKEMIGHLIHSDCASHHCKDKKRTPYEGESSKSTTTKVQNLAPPEFLHCGFWPIAQTSDGQDDDQDPSPTRRPKTRAWSPEDFSNMVDSWVADFDYLSIPTLVGLETDIAKKFKLPYSVLRLLVRKTKGEGVGGGPESSSQREALFNREMAAEAQARIEIADFVDTMVNVGDYEEAYGWILPLEVYRQVQWSKEMIKAFPRKSQEFGELIRGKLSQQK